MKHDLTCTLSALGAAFHRQAEPTRQLVLVPQIHRRPNLLVGQSLLRGNNYSDVLGVAYLAPDSALQILRQRWVHVNRMQALHTPRMPACMMAWL